MKNEINAWYNENDLILSPMGRGGPGQEHQQANLLLTKHLQNPSLMLAQNVPAAGRHRSTSCGRTFGRVFLSGRCHHLAKV
jgi:hypothetical protein